MKKYKIKERWVVSGEVETYENEKNNFIDVKDYIQGWIEGWLDTANEHDYEIKMFVRADWKYARVSFKNGDIMELRVCEVI